MNEKLLNALMQLFAIVANIGGKTKQGRQIVEVFIRQLVTLDAVSKYLDLFDDFADKHAAFFSDSDKEKKKMPVRDSVKALVICEHINEELTQKQKLIVLVRLLEFVNIDHKITEVELDFISTMATAFNISDDEFHMVRDFVVSENFNELNINSPNILTVNSDMEEEDTTGEDAEIEDEVGGINNIKHYGVENLEGEFCFLRIPSVDTYIMRYAGTGEMYLNGLAMNERMVYLFPHGSTIRNPKINPFYYSDIVGHFLHDTTKAKIVFQAEHVIHRFKGGTGGLKDVNIVEESGKMIGLMGASGAGKTTLLNALSGILPPSEGHISVNGIDIYSEKEKVEGVIGYISQDDLLMEELTVYQNLYYNAKLCLGNLSDEEIVKQVLLTLNNLGLLEIKDLKVGSPLNKKISGGQRKRLNISLELIREPSVLFVDEPTSGLSSRDSENIMDLLKELSLKGKLIFVVIHQPSSDIFKMFDKLYILDTGGYPVYYGNPIEAVIYFRQLTDHVNADKSECLECGNVNPEQIFNIIEAKVVDEYGNFTEDRKINPIQLNEVFLKDIPTPVFKKVSSPIEGSLNIASKLKQLWIFTIRDVLSKLSNTQYMLINFLEAPLLAFVLAYLVRFFITDESRTNHTYIFADNENIPAFLFMSVIVALFIGLTVSAEEIIKDQKILKREAFLNLSRTSYLFSKVMILFTISSIQMITFVIIGNYILGIKDLYLSYWLVMFATICFANMLGLNISSSFNSAVTIYILIPILIIPQLLLSGVIVKFDKLNPALSDATHVPLSGDLMASKWAFEALAVNQFKNNEYTKHVYKYDKKISIAEFKKTFLHSELASKIDFCENNFNSNKDSIIDLVHKNLLVVKNEVNLIATSYKELKYDGIEKVTPTSFNSGVANDLRKFLSKMRKYFIIKYNDYYDTRDSYIAELQNSAEKKEAFIQLKKDYYNDHLAVMLENSRDEHRIIENEGYLIQKINPIYLDPKPPKIPIDFRAHFYAPRKYFLGRYYNTFNFNIGVLWGMTIFLFIALYFDLLKKLLNVGTTISALFQKNNSKNKRQ